MNKLKQPKPFYLVFFVELWERFGYYGVQALLVLFLVRHLHYTDTKADLLFGAFTAFVYLLPCWGGFVGDRLLGTKRTIVLGAAILAAGYSMLTSSYILQSHLTWALAVIAIGNGLFKANPSSLLAKIYKGNDEYNPDSGFTLYYMAINIGSFISMALVPWISHTWNYQIAYGVCAAGLFITLINFFFMRKFIRDIGSEPDFQPINFAKLISVLVVSAIIAVVSAVLISHSKWASILLTVVTIAYFAVYFIQIAKAQPHERKPMMLFAILFIQGVVFFIMYIQMQTSLTLFALRNVTHNILFLHVQPETFQSLNPFWILVMSPVLAYVYQSLRKVDKDPSLLTKFSLGIVLSGLSFVLLYVVCGHFASQGMVSGNWLIFSYALSSAGELLVSALGFSVATQYVPQRLMGFSMGIWLLTTAVASMLGTHLASFASIPKSMTDPVQTLPIYQHLFLTLGAMAVIVGGIFAILVPLLKKMEPKQQLSS